MADNVAITPGSGATVATDDVGGVQYQRVKLDLGGDGASSPLLRGQQTKANSLPVALSSDQDAIPVTDNGGSLTVDGTVSVSGTVTVNGSGVTQPVSAASLPLPSGAATAAKQPALGTAGTAAADVITVQGIAAMTALKVDGSGVTQPVSGTVTASNTAGAAAHDAAVSGNPVLAGCEARTSDGTPVGSGDAVRAIADTLGKQVVILGAVHDLHVRGTANYTNTTAADVIATAGAGVRIAVTSVLATNAHATVGTKVEIRDGTTVKIQGYAAASGGGFSLNAGGAPLFISTANTAVTGRCVTTGADVDLTISGYKIGN